MHHPAATFGQAPSVGVYAYSFALNPADPNPSGTLNASRIENLRLEFTLKKAQLASADNASLEDQTVVGSAVLGHLHIYARNYNVLRIMSGMAGLAFSS